MKHRLYAACRSSGRAISVLVLAAASARAASGQAGLAGQEEARLLRDAATLETAGDLDGSERVLRSILTSSPMSLGALISLERILKMQGRVEGLIGPVDRLLQRDPQSPIGHQMLVRAYSALDRVEDLERAAQRWIDATPKVETPYREVARVWRQRHDPVRAVAVLELGRSRIKRQDALALELGDVYAEAGDYTKAVHEWNRAIAADGRGFLLIQRRLANLPNGGAALIPQLVSALESKPSSTARRRAAAQLAIDAGRANEAERIARGLAASLKGAERESFLVDVARRADGAGLDRLGYWAYSELVVAGGSVDRMLALRSRLAELALAVGDTAGATRMYTELERAFAVGSPQRREAIAVRVQLLAREPDLGRARAEYDGFRREFPDAPELDAVSAAVANALMDRGRHEAAEDLLVGVSGPHSGVARGRILIRRGEIERARNELLASAPALHGAEATDAIALATLLGRLSQQGGDLVARAFANTAANEHAAAIQLLFQESTSLSDAERAAVLDFAVGIADQADMREQAEQLRREIVAEYPDSREAPRAMLGLARTLASERRGADEARILLEQLILEHPRSALVPQARRELDRLLGRIPSGGIPE